MSSATAINPCFTSFCRWPGVRVEGVQSCSAKAQGGREGNTFKILVFSPIFLLFCSLLFLSLFLFSSVGKEVGREWRMVRKDIGVHKGDRQLRSPRRLWSSGWALSNTVRGLVNYVYPPPLLLAQHAHCDNKGYRSCIPNGPLDGWGVC
jgi:hypothetical protein